MFPVASANSSFHKNGELLNIQTWPLIKGGGLNTAQRMYMYYIDHGTCSAFLIFCKLANTSSHCITTTSMFVQMAKNPQNLQLWSFHISISMNEWCIYIALFLCIVVHPKRFTIMWGGVSPQPLPVCSIHLDDATAATGQRRQCAHHTLATGGEKRES